MGTKKPCPSYKIMTNYRRKKIPGALYFFTVITHERRSLFNENKARNLLNQSIQWVQERHPFTIEAIVLLPDHLHTIWKLPENDSNFSTRWSLIKKRFTQSYCKSVSIDVPLSPSRVKKRECGIWQRRFWEHYIRDEEDFSNHMNYIHYNPVKHGYVQSPRDWEWSTFHKYVAMGWYTIDWGDSTPNNQLSMCTGEIP